MALRRRVRRSWFCGRGSEAIRVESRADGGCYWDSMHPSVRADGGAVWGNDKAGTAWVLHKERINGYAARAWGL